MTEQRRVLVEQLLKRQFDGVLDPVIVEVVFFWAHLYLTCTDSSFELFTNVVDKSERKRAESLAPGGTAGAAGDQLLPGHGDGDGAAVLSAPAGPADSAP
jgi:hypothetical protein